MGTLFNQQPRMQNLNYDRIISIGENIKKLSKELDIPFNEALSLYLAVAKIDDYDAKDEQLAGLGELLQQFVEVLMDIQAKGIGIDKD